MYISESFMKTPVLLFVNFGDERFFILYIINIIYIIFDEDNMWLQDIFMYMIRKPNLFNVILLKDLV